MPWSIPRGDELLFWLGVTALALMAYYFAVQDLELRIALQGWSPLDYLNHKMFPGFFGKDWPSGITDNDYMLPFFLYRLLVTSLHLPALGLLKGLMLVQICFFLWAGGRLLQTLFQDRLVTFLALVLVMSSHLAGLNLANFGAGIGRPVMNYAAPWGFAFAFSFLALSAFLEDRWVSSLVFLALAAYCHIGLAMCAAIFVGMYLLCHPGLLFRRDVLKGLAISLAMVVPYGLLLNSTGKAIGSSAIPFHYWLVLTKTFSYHSYPWTFGLFGSLFHRYGFPFILLCALWIFFVDGNPCRPRLYSKLFLGSLAALLATAAGIALSEWWPVPMVIKLQIHRASLLVTLFALFFLAQFLVRKWRVALPLARRGNPWGIIELALVCHAVLMLVWSRPGLALFPLWGLISLDLRWAKLGPWRLSRRGTCWAATISGLVLGIMSLAVVLAYGDAKEILGGQGMLKQALASLLPCFRLDQGFGYLFRGGRLLFSHMKEVLLWLLPSAFALLIGFLVTRGSRLQFFLKALALCLVLFIPWQVWSSRGTQWKTKFGERARSFKEVQLWARRHSPPTALFMLDPTFPGYGWSDFSCRSGFGRMMEWGLHSIFYTAEVPFSRVVERFRAFGVDITRLKEPRPGDPEVRRQANIIAATIKKNFYSYPASRWRRLARRFGVDYLVMPCLRGSCSRKLELPVVFQNRDFKVYRLGSFPRGSGTSAPEGISMRPG